MHWFWRAAIAVVIGTVVTDCLVAPTIASVRDPAIRIDVLLPVFTVVLFTQVIGIFVYGFLTSRYGPTTGVRETVCRKCGYILRGISEPRCPECGKQI